MTVESSAKSNFLSIKNLTHFFPYHVALNQKSTLLVWQKNGQSFGSVVPPAWDPAIRQGILQHFGTLDAQHPRHFWASKDINKFWVDGLILISLGLDLDGEPRPEEHQAAPKQSGLSQQCRSPNKKGLVCGIHFHRNCQPAFGTSFFKKMLKNLITMHLRLPSPYRLSIVWTTFVSLPRPTCNLSRLSAA